MVKKRQRRHDGWVRRHVYSIACITLAVLLVLGSVSWYAVTTNESITGYKAEEWHYRYVGIETAKDMQSKGIKTLEQYWNISGGDY